MLDQVHSSQHVTIRSQLRFALGLILMVCAYVVAGIVSGPIISPDPQLPIVWLPSGIMLACLLIGGYCYAPGIMLGVIALGLLSGRPLIPLVILGVSNMLTIVLTVYILRNIVNFEIELHCVRDVLYLTLVGGFGCMLLGAISATIISASFMTYTTTAVISQFISFWMGSVLSIISITPMILTWYTDRHPYSSWRKIIEALALIIVVMVTSWFSFSNVLQIRSFLPIFYFILPNIVWSVFRFRLREVALVNTLMIGFLLWSIKTPDTVVYALPMTERLIFIWSFIIIGSVTALLIKVLVDERQAIAHALKNERDFATQVMETLGQGVTVSNLDGTFEYVNPAFANMMKMRADELIGQSPYTIIADSYKPELDKNHKLRRQGEASTFEVTVTASDDTELTVMSTGVPRYVDGELVGSIAVVTDITRLLEAEQARQASETQFRLLFENTEVGMYRCSPDGRFLTVNKTFAQLTGFDSPDAFMEKVDSATTEFYVDREREAQFNDILHQEGSVSDFESEVFHLTTHEKMWISESAYAVYDDNNIMQYYDGIILDITQRKLAEQEIRRSETQFRQIFENSQIGMYRTTPDGDLLLVNPYMAKMHGYDDAQRMVDEFDKNTPARYVDPNRRKQFADILNRDGQVIDFESEVYLKETDETIWINESAYSVYDDDGNIRYYEGILIDITRQKLMEKQLRRSEEQFRTIFENSSVGMYRTTPNGEILLMNSYIAQLAGYDTTEDYINAARDFPYYAYKQPNRRAQFKELLDTQGSIKDFISLIRHRNPDQIVWTTESAYVVYDDDNKPLYYEGVVVDMTRQKFIEQELQRSEAFFRAVFDYSVDCIVVVDATSRIVMSNRALQSLLGYTARELSQKTVVDYVHPEDIHREENLFQQALKNHDDGYQLELRYVTKKKEIRWIEASVGMVWDVDGQYQYAIGISRDITESRMIQLAVEQSEQRFRAIFENANIPIVVTRKNRVMYMVNPAFCEMVGYTADELIHMQFDDITYPGDNDENVEQYQKLVAGEIDNFAVTKRYLHRNGSTVWCHLSVSRFTGSIQDEDKDITYTIAIAENITERKLAEDRLQAQVRFTDKIIDALPGVFYLVDENGQFLRWNKALEQVTGFTSQEMKTIHPTDFFPPDTHTDVAEAFQEAFDDGYAIREFSMIHRDGHTVPHLLNTYAITIDDRPCVVGIGIDVSELKSAEMALRESEESYRTIFENSLMGIYRSTTSGRFLSVNPALVEMLGYDSAEELLSIDISRDVFVDAGDRTKVYDRLAQTPANVIEQPEVHLRKKNGEEIIASAKAKIIYDDDGTILYFEGNMNDITQQYRQAEKIKQLNEDLERRVIDRTRQLEQANERLTELDRLRAKFIADMSHELRTPLATLNTRLYLLKHSKDNNLDKHIDGMQLQLDRLHGYVENAFDLSILDMSRNDLTFDKVSLNDIVENVVDALDPRAQVSGVQLVYQPKADLPQIAGVENHLSQVATNLISNALKYTEAGEVIVKTGSDILGQQVYLRVSDTGMGIAEDDIPHLFSRFYRGDRAGQSTIPGSGLGLSIVKEIVDSHDGDIHIDSELDEGSTFTVWLPIESTRIESTVPHDDATPTLDE